ncbi:MAG: xylose isomerase [Phycisphaerae bacterium]|nr:MAG: xylose isomerase [Phycisphaerae bacterium]
MTHATPTHRGDGTDRRSFLLGAVSLAAGAIPLASCASPRPAKARAPLFKISLAEWSLHRTIRSGAMTNLDFPRVARDEFGISAVEYVNSFFKDKAKDAVYLADLRGRCDALGVASVLIMCDGEGALGDPDEGKRIRAVDNHRKWADAARYLGCHSIRVNAQSEGPRDEQERLAADGLRRLTEYCATLDLHCIVENHGGLSSHGDWLAAVMRRVDHPRVGTLPDFGNFYEYDRYQGVKDMMPFARGVSAKSHDFDEHGNETRTDYDRMLDIVLAAGYHGYIGVEYEGDTLPEAEGIRATKRLLERCRERRGV